MRKSLSPDPYAREAADRCLYSFGELKVFIDMILEITGSVGHFRPPLTSRALIGLLDTMDKIRGDASFPEAPDPLSILPITR